VSLKDIMMIVKTTIQLLIPQKKILMMRMMLMMKRCQVSTKHHTSTHVMHTEMLQIDTAFPVSWKQKVKCCYD
jgi:hypothetical protein